MSTNFDDFDQEEMGYEEMVGQEYLEVHSLGMKPVIAAMCDVLLIPEFIDQFIGPLDPRVKITIGVLIKAMIINFIEIKGVKYASFYLFQRLYSWNGYKIKIMEW